MSQLAAGQPAYALFASFHRFSVDAYHRMLATGILDEDGRTELLEGYLVTRMGYNPPHASAVVRTRRRIERLITVGWEVREEKPITLPDSEPIPDVAVARGDEARYGTRHPEPADLVLLVEVADTSLQIDRQDKARLYAQVGIPEYWIVNIPDRQIEVYTQPSGPATTPSYAQVRVYAAGSSVPLVLDGVNVGSIAVADVLV